MSEHPRLESVTSERSTDQDRSNRVLFAVALLAVALTAGALDQLTKWIAAATLTPGSPADLIPGLLNLRLRFNPHGAFGLFAGVPISLRIPILLSLSVVGMAAITYLGVKTLGCTRRIAVGLGLVLGGGLANLIDRALRGEVIDFIHFHWAGRNIWPTFNLADIAISVGLLFLIIATFRQWRTVGERKTENQP